MTAVLPRPTSVAARPSAIPVPRRPVHAVVPSPVAHTPAVGYQLVLHRMVRREFRVLAELARWAPADDAGRAAELTAHADLVARVLMQHPATERDLLWPALFRSLSAGEQEAARGPISSWTDRAALLDHTLRDLSTVGRQWAVALAPPSREAFARACAAVADAVDAATAAEERELLPLVDRHLPSSEWAAVRRAAHTSLPGREQMLVLGLALEDACALDRARLLAGLPRAARTAWRVVGRRTFHAHVVRLRGAPPAA